MLWLTTDNKISWIISWGKFNLVGLLGVVLQLSLLKLFVTIGVCYLVATLIAVEITIIHNFFWHEHWTWRERTSKNFSSQLIRLAKFNTSTGLISLVGNLLLMKVFVSNFHLPVVLANFLAIASCSIFNFLVSNLFVFQKTDSSLVRLK
ncbi:MAG: GtrA family protein [Acidobacteria bacterium]|nr:GtrA family protein [Acidobacteriota bacterium]